MKYKVEVSAEGGIVTHSYAVFAGCESKARRKAFCRDNGFTPDRVLTHRGRRLVKKFTRILEVLDE